MYTKNNPSLEFTKLKKFYKKIHTDGSVHANNIKKKSNETYDGKSTSKFFIIIKKIINKNKFKTLLDYGSGKGSFYFKKSIYGNKEYPPIKNFWKIQPTLYDPGIKEYKKPIKKKFDIVISIDVLEHIPPQDLFWVINEIFSFSKNTIFLNIACYPAGAKFEDGRNVHISLFHPMWWCGFIKAISEKYDLKVFLVCSYFYKKKLEHTFFSINDEFKNYK